MSSVAIFLENPIPGLAIGAVLITFCGLVFLSKRSLSALYALVGALVLTLLLFFAEQFVVTERESVELAMTQLLVAVEENDTPAAVALVDPAATELQSEVKLLMPLIEVSDTKASNVSIEVDSSTKPLEATCRFRGKLQGIHSSSGAQVFYFDNVDTYWIKSNEQWLLKDFVPYFRGKALNAVESARGNRPATSGS